MKKKILFVLLTALVVIQFIQPVHNEAKQASGQEINRLYVVPKSVGSILRTSCYDCHSDNTIYPWYSFLQPIAWWMASHIKEGKSELNFDQFGRYSVRRQQSKLKSIASSVRDDDMPLSSYTIIHRNAALSTKDKQLILEWAAKMIDRLPQNK